MRLTAAKWGPYRLGKLFDIQNTLSFNTDRLTDGDEYDYVTRTSYNQGILQTTGYVNQENINPAGIWSLGLLQMDFFYRNKPWYAGQFVRKVIPKIDIPEKAKLFFQTILNMQKPVLLQVLVRNVDETFRNIEVQLPEKSKGEIDFEFIDNFVRELERARLRELEAYLVATGLNNYELTVSDKAALNRLSTLQWKPFPITKVFTVRNTHNILASNVKLGSGTTPYLCASAEDNGICGYISHNNDLLEQGNCVFIGGKTFVVSYQKDDFFSNDSHNIALYLKDHAPTRLNQLSLVTCVKKSLGHKYTWGDSVSKAKINKDTIMLPVCADGETPDLATMEQIVAAVQKIVIADVAKYTARNLEATQQVIEAEDEPQFEQTITPLITEPKESEKYISLLPVYSLRAACGYFGDGEEVEELGWMQVEGMGRLNKDMFVVQAVGQSMEPRIHNGDYCVFEKYSGGSRQGKIVLAQHRGYFDEDNAGAYSIKEYSSEKSYNDDGSWQHESITLRPFNPAYEPIRIDAEDAESFAIIGEFVGVVTL